LISFYPSVVDVQYHPNKFSTLVLLTKRNRFRTLGCMVAESFSSLFKRDSNLWIGSFSCLFIGLGGIFHFWLNLLYLFTCLNTFEHIPQSLFSVFLLFFWRLSGRSFVVCVVMRLLCFFKSTVDCVLTRDAIRGCFFYVLFYLWRSDWRIRRIWLFSCWTSWLRCFTSFDKLTIPSNI
jgi:hypothetical protein